MAKQSVMILILYDAMKTLADPKNTARILVQIYTNGPF